MSKQVNRLFFRMMNPTAMSQNASKVPQNKRRSDLGGLEGDDELDNAWSAKPKEH